MDNLQEIVQTIPGDQAEHEATVTEGIQSVSVIIPVYNEAESLPILQNALHQALDSLEFPWEVVYVDDGSADQSMPILLDIASEDADHVCIVRLRRNFGQTAALSAGIDVSRGEILIPMDGDLQNDPEDILTLLQKIEEGYDVVSGWRKDRKDPFLTRRLPSANHAEEEFQNYWLG